MSNSIYQNDIETCQFQKCIAFLIKRAEANVTSQREQRLA